MKITTFLALSIPYNLRGLWECYSRNLQNFSQVLRYELIWSTQKLPQSINSRRLRFVLAVWVSMTIWNVSAEGEPATSINDRLVSSALQVLAGRDRTYATIDACEPTFRESAFDLRFFVSFWDSERFEIFEGARLALERVQANDKNANLSRPQQSGSLVVLPTSCDALIRSNRPGYLGIEGVAEEDLQRMRESYAASHPHPQVARDRSLHNDCMKANFNARQSYFYLAKRNCDCTLAAMQTVPSDQLDSWLASARTGAGSPMHQQPWFGTLLPKLQACLVR